LRDGVGGKEQSGRYELPVTNHATIELADKSRAVAVAAPVMAGLKELPKEAGAKRGHTNVAVFASF